jgi:amino acid adenylation domain-containing protein
LEWQEIFMSVLQLFERNVIAAPDALAITSESWRITYRELNTTADQIAAALRDAGVNTGSLVGVLLDRSPQMIAALLGIWRAGGAYIPLDPGGPVERVAFMLEDAAPQLVLTRRKFFHRCGVCRVLDVDDLCRQGSSSRHAANTISAESLAYVIYTSGTTGKPKGTKITHGGLANTIQSVGEDLKLEARDVVLAWSTIAFDVSCLEIYLPLVFGSSLYLVEKELVNEGGSRVEQLRRSAATVMFGTPTMYRLLLEAGWKGDPRVQVVVGGETLPLNLGRTLARTCAAAWNQYGPTETAICATRAKIDADATKITVGHPLPNVTVHVLDPHLQPVRKGLMGELYIGGAGVGAGYLYRDDLDQTHFLPDPFAGSSQGKLYKSGDLAVELADGSLDLLGRVDGQVKIRGFRIELGEIESALRRCDGLRAVVVRAIELEPGDRRLVAFVVGDGTLMPLWKERLRRQLPEYMVPSEMVLLRFFPTTLGGKVDVQALDAMRLRAFAVHTESELRPVDAVEAQVTAIWERLLKVKSIGHDDDFFALGGHSLLAVRMLAQVEKWFGCQLPESVLVEHPTIRGLASYLRESAAKQWPAPVLIHAGGSLPPLFLAHGIGGSLLSFMDLAAGLDRQQPVYGLEVPAFIYQHQADLSVFAANYVKQVRTIQPYGPYNLAGHSSGGLIVFEMACQLMEQGETVGLLALLDCDPHKGKHLPQHQDGDSLRAFIRRTRAEINAPELGMKDLFERRRTHLRIRFRTWLAARSRGAENAGGRLVRSEGYLVLAVEDYELRPFPGKATLFIAQDEPGCNADPAKAWADKILGGCETRFLPGTHRTMLIRPQVTALARELNQRLARNVIAAATSVVA